MIVENLIESRNATGEGRKVRKYLISVGTMVSALFVCGLIVSIFSTNLAMETGAIDLSTLVAPAPIPEAAPPEPEIDPKQRTSKTKDTSITTRAKNLQRTDEIPVSVPDKISSTPNQFKARPRSSFVLSDLGDSDGSPPKGAAPNQVKAGGPSGFGNTVNDGSERPDKIVPKTTVVTTPPPAIKKPLVTSRVVNSMAKTLVRPVYSQAAKAVGAKGTVEVSVLIGENGRVLSANATSGHALLRPLAVRAALKSTFTTTFVSGVAVQVRGVIVYNFK